MATPITDVEFDSKVLKSPLPVLLDFWAPWCGPCKAMLPVVEEITQEFAGKVNVYKMNVDECMETSQKYNVMSIPTFVLFKGGQPVETFIGVKSKEVVAAKLNALL